MKTLLIWGAGDQGTVTLDCAVAMQEYSKIDFLDFKDRGYRAVIDRLIYHEGEEDLHDLLHAYDEVIVATGDNDLREITITMLKEMDIPLATILHPTAIIAPSASIAKGTTILANAVINANATIGAGCIINTAAIVEHDCIVEDFVNISPNVSMAGHTKIGKKAFLGIGSTIIDEIEIGKDTIIGAGAVVIHDIPAYAMAVGVPAKIKSQ